MNNQSLLIALLATVISPAILAIISNHITGRQRRAEKKLDWAREDAVAAKAEEAAKLLLASNERVADNAKVTNGKLDQIHTLVNSNLTASMKGELEATIAKLVVLKKLAGRDERDKVDVSESDLKDIRDTEARIAEMTAILNDRLQQTKIAEDKAKGNNQP